jgi:hypothetical protein
VSHEETRELVTVEVIMRCECGGEMRKLSHVQEWPNPNAKYPHKCTKCERQEMFSKVYPAIEHKVKEET